MAACAACGSANVDGATACVSCGVGFAGSPPPFLMSVNPPPPQHVPVPSPPRPLPQPWRDVLSSDPTEQALLVAIRAKPNDEAARAVYADWLEQRGDPRAGIVRSTDGPVAGDAAWRRVAACVMVNCNRTNCWGGWNTFEADPKDELLRRCQNCDLTVRYCETADDAAYASYFRITSVFDPGADRDELQRARDAALLAHANNYQEP